MATSKVKSAQISENVTQSNVRIVAEAPAMATGNIYQTLAHSMGLLFENSVNAQSQAAILGQTATTQSVMQIFANEPSGMVGVPIKAQSNGKKRPTVKK